MDAALTDEELDEYEEEYEDLDEKLILLEIMGELKAIRMLLEQGTAESAQTARYECATCGATVPAEERQDHLTDEHNYPIAASFEEEFESCA